MRVPFEAKYCRVSVCSIFPKDGIEYDLERIGRICPCCYTELYGNVKYMNDTFTREKLMNVLKNSGYNYEESSKIIKERYQKTNENFKEASEQSKKITDIKTCPVCGESLSDESGYFIVDRKYTSASFLYALGEDFDDLFFNMNLKRNESIKKQAKEKTENYINKCRRNFIDTIVSVSNENNPLNSNVLLKNYLKSVFSIETNIYEFTQKLEMLWATKGQLDSDYAKTKEDEKKAIYNEIITTVAEIDNFDDADIEEISFPTVCYAQKPMEPQVPVFEMKEPIEPSYENPSIFNKKRIIEKNEELKNNYEKEISSYNLLKSKHQEALEKYESDFQAYKQALEEYNEDCAKKEEAARNEYLKKVEEKQTEREREKEILLRKVEEKRKKIKEVSKPSISGHILIDKEIEKVKKILENSLDALNKLYALNIIYPKYRNMVAIASFCDYLLSGRCETLSGPDGAYNLFENETRSDLIITKLSDIVASLGAIQDNQYMLYNKLSDINIATEELNNSMEKAIISLNKMESNSEETIKLLKSIEDNSVKTQANTALAAKNSAVIAHYSEAIAYYSKKNAEISNALGYLIALK